MNKILADWFIHWSAMLVSAVYFPFIFQYHGYRPELGFFLVSLPVMGYMTWRYCKDD